MAESSNSSNNITGCLEFYWSQRSFSIFFTWLNYFPIRSSDVNFQWNKRKYAQGYQSNIVHNRNNPQVRKDCFLTKINNNPQTLVPTPLSTNCRGDGSEENSFLKPNNTHPTRIQEPSNSTNSWQSSINYSHREKSKSIPCRQISTSNSRPSFQRISQEKSTKQYCQRSQQF